MHRELVFFDTVEESKNGTIRAFVALIVILALSSPLVYYMLQRLNYRSVLVSLSIFYFLLISAIGVLVPIVGSVDYFSSFVYGLLVGTCFFGTILAMLYLLNIVNVKIVFVILYNILVVGVATVVSQYI